MIHFPPEIWLIGCIALPMCLSLLMYVFGMRFHRVFAVIAMTVIPLGAVGLLHSVVTTGPVRHQLVDGARHLALNFKSAWSARFSFS